MTTLNDMTIKSLVELHNTMLPEAEHLANWKGRKDLLIEKVKELIAKTRGPVTIKSVSIDWLTRVAEVVDDKPIGYSYEHILAEIFKVFPDAKTTVKCLRWYNTKLNSDPNVRMPVRPRKKVVREDLPGQAVDLQAEAEEPEQVADPLA